MNLCVFNLAQFSETVSVASGEISWLAALQTRATFFSHSLSFFLLYTFFEHSVNIVCHLDTIPRSFALQYPAAVVERCKRSPRLRTRAANY